MLDHNSSVIYVAQDTGNDRDYSGLAPEPGPLGEGPFRTIPRALDAVRELRKTGNLRPVTVSITEDYFLQETIIFSDGACSVTLESYGSRKTITGGLRITGWQRDVFNGTSCFSAKLPAKSDGTLWDFTDFYVNGRRALLTRYPKDGSLDAIDTEKNEETLFSHSRWFIAKKEDLEHVAGIEDAIVNFNHYWIDEHTPVERYDAETGKLTMKYASRFSVNTKYGNSEHPGALHYYLTNVPTMFSSPNEWYLDRKTGTVYYIPENPDTRSEEIEAYAPVAAKLMEIRENDVRIRNLELSFTRGEYLSTVPDHVSTGEETAYASDIQSMCWAHGSIVFENAQRCSITDCDIHGIGVHAIEIKTGCKGIRMENNRIDDIGAGGIKIFGGEHGCDPALLTEGCVIKGNSISHCGKRYAAGCGILICHAANNEIGENEIHHLDYTGISVGWVWGYAESSTYGNLIRKNHIHHIGLGCLSDMGGIYLLGKQKGTIVAENRVHDVSAVNYGGWGIYTDEGSSYITIENNIVYNTGSENFHQHYGSYNTVRNNIFAFGSACVRLTRYEFQDSVLLENNIFVTNGTPVYAGDNSQYVLNKRNLFWDVSGRPVILWRKDNGEECDLDTWQGEMGKDTGSIAADPGFQDVAAYDFSLKPDSPARALK